MIKIKIAYANQSEQDAFEHDLSEIEGIKVERVEQSGFDGTELIYYFITTGGAVCLLTSIKEVIIKAIERNKDNYIKVGRKGEVELKGYSGRDSERLLDKVLKEDDD